MKRWLSVPLKLFAGLVLSAAIFEGYLRLAEATPLWRVLPAAQVSIYGPDPDTGYAIRPNVSGVWLTENRAWITTSPQALRDADVPFEKPPGTRRIAIVGDSITEALQVEEERTFTSALERRYAEAGKNIEVVNLGISGALPTVQLARMKALGLRFEPDLMVFMIKASDFLAPAMHQDDQFPGYVRTTDGNYELGYGFRETRSYRLRTSVLGELLYAAMDHLRILRVVNARRNRGFGLATAGADEARPSGACDPKTIERMTSVFDPRSQDLRAAQILDAYLRDVAALSETAEAPAVFAMNWPRAACQAEEDALGALRRTAIRRLEIAGLGVIDLDGRIGDALAERTDARTPADLYGFGARLGFGHLNAFGHRVYADALAAGLRRWIADTR